jgi:replicative DNA helicase
MSIGLIDTTKYEEILCNTMLDYPEFIPEILAKVKYTNFKHAWVKNVFQELRSQSDEGIPQDYMVAANRVHTKYSTPLEVLFPENFYSTTGYNLIITELNDCLARNEMALEARKISGQLHELTSTEMANSFSRLSKMAKPSIAQVNKSKVLDWILDPEKKPVFIPTGFAKLDQQIGGGLERGELVCLAARPGMGKTAFALSLALRMANVGVKVLFVSLEMPANQLFNRALAAYASVPMSIIKKKNYHVLNDEDRVRFYERAKRLKEIPLQIVDNSRVSTQELSSICLQEKPDVLVLDYLQLMNYTGKHTKKNDIVSEMSRDMKILAKDNKMAVIELSQLSRDIEKRRANSIGKKAEASKPILSDLRDSGAIEQDADMVWFVNRDSYWDKDKRNSSAELDVAKQRNGEPGAVSMVYNGMYTRFDE